MAKKKTTKKLFSKKDTFTIKDFDEIKKDVLEDQEKRQFNPSVLLDEDTGPVFKDGKPYMIVGNEYIPYDEAKLLFQKRKVVREYLRLEQMEKNLKTKKK